MNLYAYDVECTPNFFSVSFIDIIDYCNIFNEAKNDKGKKIPLTDLYKVEEIKEKLTKVKKWSFYLTDEDDSQKLQLYAFINNLNRYPSQEEPKGCRTDLFGYNSYEYDKLIVASFMMNFNNYRNTKDLLLRIYEDSKRIISLQNNEDKYKDFGYRTLRDFTLPYIDVDLYKVFALNKAGSGVDGNGEKVYFGKSLKQMSINLKWYELLDWTMPPISSENECLKYHKFDPRYRGLSAQQLNSLINTWDRFILPEFIPNMLHYNENDVFIVCEMFRLYYEEVKLRYTISHNYKIDVLNSSRSNINDKFFEKFYTDFSKQSPSIWKGKKTERGKISFKNVIFDNVEFKTPELKQVLEEIKRVIVTNTGKSSFTKNVTIGKVLYTLATGGIHSKDLPSELRAKVQSIPFTGLPSQITDNVWEIMSDDDYIYVHADVTSFYPSLMVEYNIAPAHMDKEAFVNLVKWLKDTRVQAKHSKEDFIEGVHKSILAELLKIVINAIYGKLNYAYGDLYDVLAALKVTINGQLFLLMLCEELHSNGLEVVSANTDGIYIKIYKRQKEIYDKILIDWQKHTKMQLDSEEIGIYICRDVNNYIAQEFNGKITRKGALNKNLYLNDLSKGYNAPIVAEAVEEYLLKGTPILETLYKATNILDFCMTQNVARKFYVSMNTLDGKEETIQRNVRFYASREGGYLYKCYEDKKYNLCKDSTVIVLNTLDDKPIELRSIDYSYYYKRAMDIITPIKLGISPSQKGNSDKGTVSGKKLIKKYGSTFDVLFDDDEWNNLC